VRQQRARVGVAQAAGQRGRQQRGQAARGARARRAVQRRGQRAGQARQRARRQRCQPVARRLRASTRGRSATSLWHLQSHGICASVPHRHSADLTNGPAAVRVCPCCGRASPARRRRQQLACGLTRAAQPTAPLRLVCCETLAARPRPRPASAAHTTATRAHYNGGPALAAQARCDPVAMPRAGVLHATRQPVRSHWAAGAARLVHVAVAAQAQEGRPAARALRALGALGAPARCGRAAARDAVGRRELLHRGRTGLRRAGAALQRRVVAEQQRHHPRERARLQQRLLPPARLTPAQTLTLPLPQHALPGCPGLCSRGDRRA